MRPPEDRRRDGESPPPPYALAPYALALARSPVAAGGAPERRQRAVQGTPLTILDNNVLIMATSITRRANSTTRSDRIGRNNGAEGSAKSVAEPTGVTTRSVAVAATPRLKTVLRERNAVLDRFQEARGHLNLGYNAALAKKKKKPKNFSRLTFDKARLDLQHKSHADKYNITADFKDRPAEDFLRGLPAHLLPGARQQVVEQQVVVETREALADHRFYFNPDTGIIVSCIQGSPYAARWIQQGFREHPHFHAGATDIDFDVDFPLPSSQPQPGAGPAPPLALVDRPAPDLPFFPEDEHAEWPPLFNYYDNKKQKETYAASVVRAVEEKVLDTEHQAVYSPFYMWTSDVMVNRCGFKSKVTNLSNYLKEYCAIRGLMADQDPKTIKWTSKRLQKDAGDAKQAGTFFGGGGGMPAGKQYDGQGKVVANNTWLVVAAFLAKRQLTAAE